MNKSQSTLLALALATLFCSCSTNREYVITDPYEPANRELFDSLLETDRKIVRPAALFFRDRLNQPLRIGVRNAVYNVETINHIFNDLLQLRFHRFFHDSARLILNSTIGVLGIFDVASRLGLEAERNDLGKTFAHWGWTDSAIIVVPFYAHFTVRETFATSLELLFFHPLRYLNFSIPEFLIYELIRGVNRRIDLFEIDGFLQDPSIIDKYAFARQYYQESRVLFITRDDKGEVETEVIWSDEELDLLD